MGVLRETTARWIRMLTIMGDGSLSVSEQSRLITKVNGPVQLNLTHRYYRWPWQRTIAKEVGDAAGTASLTVLNRYLQAAHLTTEHLIHRLHETTGESREQILQELSVSVDATIAAAEAADDETA